MVVVLVVEMASFLFSTIFSNFRIRGSGAFSPSIMLSDLVEGRIGEGARRRREAVWIGGNRSRATDRNREGGAGTGRGDSGEDI